MSLVGCLVSMLCIAFVLRDHVAGKCRVPTGGALHGVGVLLRTGARAKYTKRAAGEVWRVCGSSWSLMDGRWRSSSKGAACTTAKRGEMRRADGVETTRSATPNPRGMKHERHLNGMQEHTRSKPSSMKPMHTT